MKLLFNRVSIWRSAIASSVLISGTVVEGDLKSGAAAAALEAEMEEEAARQIARALMTSESKDLYREIEGFYTAVVGRSNTLSPAALFAVRKTLEKMPPVSMEDSVYNYQLEALFALARTATDSRFPEVMRTAAYHDRKMEAVPASWTELRHDTVPVVEQSVGGVGCQDPKGYVEPVPEMYRALSRAVARMADAFGASAKEAFPYLLENYDTDPEVDENFFNHWRMVLKTSPCSTRRRRPTNRISPNGTGCPITPPNACPTSRRRAFATDPTASVFKRSRKPDCRQS